MTVFFFGMEISNAKLFSHTLKSGVERNHYGSHLGKYLSKTNSNAIRFYIFAAFRPEYSHPNNNNNNNKTFFFYYAKQCLRG